MEKKYMTITVTRNDDPATWTARYTVSPDTPHARREWGKIYNSCKDDTGMEPLLLEDGETDSYRVPAE